MQTSNTDLPRPMAQIEVGHRRGDAKALMLSGTFLYVGVISR